MRRSLIMPSIHRAPGLFLLLAAAACGADDSAPLAAPPAPTVEPAPEEPPPETPAPDAGPQEPAWKLTFPQVLSRGGPVIASPKVLPIVFAGDTMIADITSFTQKIATSTYWKNTAAEYGVGPITALTPVVLNEPAPTDLTNEQIETWLVEKLTSQAFGPADPNTLYALFYPEGTTITFEEAGAFGQSCQGYGAYHYEVDAGGAAIGFAVMPRCGDVAELTVAASHEYFEWATDPFPQTNPAFNRLTDEHWAWQATMIGELSDLCTFLDRDMLAPTEIGFTVQRHWSNKAALPGGYPCAPTKGTPYLQAIPKATDDALVPAYSGGFETIRTKAIRVPAGKSRTVEMYVYSDQPISKQVPLRVLSYNEFYLQQESSGYTYELDRSYASPGETVKLTVTAPKSKAFDLALGLAYTSDTSAHFWPVLVTNDAPPPPAKTPSKQPIVPSITREEMPRAPKDLGFNHRARKGYGSRIEPYSTVRAALIAARARASLPSSLMTEVGPR